MIPAHFHLSICLLYVSVPHCKSENIRLGSLGTSILLSLAGRLRRGRDPVEAFPMSLPFHRWKWDGRPTTLWIGGVLMRTGLNLCSWSSCRTYDVLHVLQCERYKRTAITPQESDAGLNYRERRLRDYGEKKQQIWARLPTLDHWVWLTQSTAIFIRPKGVLCVNVMFSKDTMYINRYNSNKMFEGFFFKNRSHMLGLALGICIIADNKRNNFFE